MTLEDFAKHLVAKGVSNVNIEVFDHYTNGGTPEQREVRFKDDKGNIIEVVVYNL